MNLNKIQIIGRITKEPELKVTQSGMKVCSISVATNHKFKQEEKWKETTTFHEVVSFGKTAEAIAQYFVKGQEIYVEGRQEHQSYEKKDGTKGYRSQIILERFEFGQKPQNAVQQKPAQVQEDDDIQFPPDEINPEDIPF